MDKIFLLREDQNFDIVKLSSKLKLEPQEEMMVKSLG